MADNVERQRRRSADDQKLRKVVHGGHDSGRAYAPKDVGGDQGEVWDGVEEGDEGNKQADGDWRLVEEELGRGNGEIFNLLADPDLVESGGAKGQCGDDNAEELRSGFGIHGQADADARGQDSREHISCHHLAEEDKVDEHDGGRCHDLGELVEADRVEGQAEVAEHDIAGEEAAHGQHVPDVEADGFKRAERAEGRDEENETCCGEMPHDDHELAGFELLIAEHSVYRQQWHHRYRYCRRTVCSGKSSPV